jgi:hypothetical protein
MASTIKQIDRNCHATEASFEATRVDYKRLGLSVAESRVDVIRAATRRQARRAYEGAVTNEGVEVQLSSIALTAYRLLDPRRRPRMSERVQLCYPLDRDDPVQLPQQLSILDSPEPPPAFIREPDSDDFEVIDSELVQLIESGIDHTIYESRQVVEFLRKETTKQRIIFQNKMYRWSAIAGSSLLGIVLFFGAFWIVAKSNRSKAIADVVGEQVNSDVAGSGKSSATAIKPNAAPVTFPPTPAKNNSLGPVESSTHAIPDDWPSESPFEPSEVSLENPATEGTIPTQTTTGEESHVGELALREQNSIATDATEQPEPIASSPNTPQPSAAETQNQSPEQTQAQDSTAIAANPTESLLRIESSRGLIDWSKSFTLELGLRSDWGLKSKQWLMGDVELLPMPEAPGVQVAGWQAWLEPGKQAGKRSLFLATSAGVQLELPQSLDDYTILGISSDGTTAKLSMDGTVFGEFQVAVLQQGHIPSSQQVHFNTNALYFTQEKANKSSIAFSVVRMWNVAQKPNTKTEWKTQDQPTEGAILWIDRDSSGLWLDMARDRHVIRTVGFDSLPAIRQTQVQKPTPPDQPQTDPWLAIEQDNANADSKDVQNDLARAKEPDEQDLKVSRDRLARILKDEFALARTDSDARRQLTVELAKLARESEPGSADRFAILESLITNVLEDAGLAAAIRYCDRLENEFECSAWKRRVELFEQQSKRADTLDSYRELTMLGCHMGELALQKEELEAATELFRLAIVAGNRSQDDELKSLAKRRKDDVALVRRRITSKTKAQTRLEQNESDAQAAGEIGIYLAVVRGDWQAAAPLLAKAEDARWKNVGELETKSPSDSESQTKLATLLADCAAALKSREADIVRMRSIHWLQQAVTNARGLLRAEIEDMLAKQEALLPVDRQPQSIARFATSQNEATTNAGTSSIVDVPEELQGMLGRILVDGMDAGVLLRYEAGVEINDAQMVDILNSVNRKGDTIRVEFIGLLMLKQKTELKIIQLAGSAKMGFGQVAVDGKIVGQMGGQDTTSPSSYSVTLEPGEHRVVWTLTGGRLGNCRLQAQMGETNQPIPLAYTPAVLTQMKTLPTPLRVNLVRNKAKRT